jgi:hypothetical protein
VTTAQHDVVKEGQKLIALLLPTTMSEPRSHDPMAASSQIHPMPSSMRSEDNQASPPLLLEILLRYIGEASQHSLPAAKPDSLRQQLLIG